MSSIASAGDDDEVLSESVIDRIAALADIVPPETRLQLQRTANAASEWGWWGVSGVCKASWLVAVSGLLVGIPFAFAQQEDLQFAMEEKQQQMQQGSNDVSTLLTADRLTHYTIRQLTYHRSWHRARPAHRPSSRSDCFYVRLLYT